MKQYYIIVILILMAFSSGISQEFKGGLTAGLVGSQVAGDCCSGYNKAGVFAGGYVYYQFSKHSILQMELEYIQKGSRQNPREENDYKSFLLRIHYVELPIIYRFVIIQQFNVEIGLSYGVFIADKEKVDGEVIDGTPFNRHNLNFIGGLYYNINERFRINLRSNNSITPIRPHVSGKSRFFNHGQYSDAISLGVQVDL